jgi:hypothetical protein
MAKVSFLVTYYNQENFVAQSLESIINTNAFASNLQCGVGGVQK